ncbi:MAG: pyridoxine-5-phosphate oxidase [Pseudomonadota bacterium]|jgi:pyridoxamine 5'-phosphate oxidase
MGAKKKFELTTLNKNPLKEFEAWFAAAQKSGELTPDAMTLSTCSRDGRPSARVVLYKGLSRGAFRIFTNLESRKGRELKANPFAALTFHWRTLARQVRIEGKIVPMPRAQAEKYFHSRPRNSQLGAWASKQSTPIASRDFLMKRLAHYDALFQNKTIPLPEHWGGFLLQPDRLEFWIDGEFRLHDRFEFVRRLNARGTLQGWMRQRLSP